jgi:endonuclease III
MFGELEASPGMGHKIASVIMGQCFDKPAFPVDIV